MEDHGWLRNIVENMQNEIHEIKKDVKDIKEFKFKIVGGIIAISSLITIIVNIFVFLVKHV